MADKYLPFKQDGVEYNLYDMPKGFVIEGDLNLAGRGLTELPDLSEIIVRGDFLCCNNQLTSLKGAPKKVGKHFSCSRNQLTSLEGAPQTVGGNFWCSNNHLTSLKGAPKTVSGIFDCIGNELFSLYGISAQMPNRTIFCDDAMVQKYTKAPGYSLSAGELYNSTPYQIEVANGLIQKQKNSASRDGKPEENLTRAEKNDRALAKTREAFQEWLQKNNKQK